jgi:hypothetical protein
VRFVKEAGILSVKSDPICGCREVVG